MSCVVCGYENSNLCLHFGAKSCKACAAFFRRTISMKLDYECINEETACKVKYDSKLICRYCRFQKCLRIGMKPTLVKSKKERTKYIRMSRGLVKRNKKHKNYKDSIEISQDTSDFPISAHIRIDAPHEILPEAGTSHTKSVVDQFIKLEHALNDRRRLLYGETQIRDVFVQPTDCPYDRSSIKMYNYKLSQGMSKHDFVMMMDYARTFPGFEELNYTDKIFCYRLICAVDFVMSSAYYTYRVGIDDNLLVLCDGSYIPMIPEPITGHEENAQLLFENPDDLIKYRTMMSLFMKQWKMCQPFAKLNLSLGEFAILKGICSWHVSYYRLTESGRNIAKIQRNSLMKALYQVCELNCGSQNNVEERFGNLLLGLNYIMEQIRNVNCSFVLISFFGILNVDSLMLDVTSFW